MNLVDRAKNIILTPATEWPVIETEATTPQELYLGYIMILSAIGPVASLISRAMFGFFGLFYGLMFAIVGYILGLVGVFLVALLADFLAPKFNGISNQRQALKLMAYSLTAAWLAGIFNLIPVVGSLLVLLAALYGLYLFYLGATVLMKVPIDKAAPYTAVVVVIVVIIGFLLSSIFGVMAYRTGMFASAYPGSNMAARQAANNQAAAIALTAAAIQASADAQRTANASATATPPAPPTPAANTQVNAANPAAALAALAGGGAVVGQTVDPVDKEILKALLPNTVGSLPRTGTEATNVGMATMQVSEADGDYGDQTKHVKLKIVDMGGAQMLGLAAAWAMVDVDRSSDTGYEKTGKVNGRPTHEKFDKSSGSGEYAVLVANRFLVSADGNADMSALKDGVAAVDSSKLESMKDVGSHKTN